MSEALRKIGFFTLGIISFLYIVFSRGFAEMHLQLSFLDFPVFVGELSLILCFILVFFVFDSRLLKGWQWWVVLYFAFVIAKALLGYNLWGALAFRHAALFYYPIFVFFGFIFYNKAFLSEPLKILSVALIFTVSVMRHFNDYWLLPVSDYWLLPLWVIAFILIRSFSSRRIRKLFYIGLIWVIFLSQQILIMTSRAFIVGNIMAAVFLIAVFLFIAKWKVFYKAVVTGSLLILLAVFVYKYSSVNASGTILDINNITRKYRFCQAELEYRQPYYVPRELNDVRLFDSKQPYPLNEPEKSLNENTRVNRYSVLTAEMKDRGSHYAPENSEVRAIVPSNSERVFSPVDDRDAEPKKTFNSNQSIDKAISQGRVIDDAYGNILFRLFIWRDMLVEFSLHRPIFGFSFGRPLRSVSLEILNWGNNDWIRDGWIEPHNSYLNILYRMGILGVALIGFLIWQFSSMVKGFLSLKSSVGILLCSILVIWLAAANFLPILELPYTAIPFWAFWGASLGYLEELKDKRRVL